MVSQGEYYLHKTKGKHTWLRKHGAINIDIFIVNLASHTS
jgi:hypothetical protein